MARAFEVPTGTGDVEIITNATGGHTKFLGFSAHESAGTPAVAAFQIEDQNGKMLAVCELAADKSDSLWLGPQGIVADGGIQLNRLTGETHLVIYYE